MKRHAPATARNRDPILDVLRRVLPDGPGTRVLEIASGSGEHAAYFAGALPHVLWQPTDRDAAARASIDAHRVDASLANLLRALELDAASDAWPIDAHGEGPRGVDAIVCINMIHIAPWEACLGLLRGAARVLPHGGVLYLYGPYRQGGVHTADTNARFDEALRAEDPRWGVRDLDDVVARAAGHGLAHRETVAMPANNLSVVFRRGE